MSTGVIIALVVAFVVVDALIMWRVLGRVWRNSPRRAAALDATATTPSTADDLYLQQHAAGLGTMGAVAAGDPVPPTPPAEAERATAGEGDAGPEPAPTPEPEATPAASSDDEVWSLGGGWSESGGGGHRGGSSD